MRAFLDTSIGLDVLVQNARAKTFASMTLGLEREWCASPLVRMESLVRALAENDGPAIAKVEAWFQSLSSLPLTDAVFDRAAHIRAQTGLKALDALHIATALEHGCAEFWTADARLSRTTLNGLTPRLVV